MRIFMNGRGIPAQSPLPPGLFGYDADYLNPVSRRSISSARARCSREAGYPGGIDPATGKPLHLTFDTGDTSARGRLRYQFFVDAWRRLGIDVEIAATTYNQFQDKVRRGAYQIFMWGWVADYPDPENFLFLLLERERAQQSGGPNTANFADPEFDRALPRRCATCPNGAERAGAHPPACSRSSSASGRGSSSSTPSRTRCHGWVRNVKPLGMSFSTLKYQRHRRPERAAKRREWNQPVRWPASRCWPSRRSSGARRSRPCCAGATAMILAYLVRRLALRRPSRCSACCSSSSCSSSW